MLRDAALCFAMTLVASFAGFGGVMEGGLMGDAAAPTKALAVICLVLFLVSLYRVLNESAPAPRSIES
jgi:uncharacterized membrane protein YtjA (UPF0391 family)